MVTISIKVYERLKRLADNEGRFFMLAIDQRGSIKKLLAKIHRVHPFQVPDKAIAEIKKIIVEILARYATGVLIDPEYGFEGGYQAIPPPVGKLLTLEKSGGEKVMMNGTEEERTVLLANWSAEEALAKGADAVKLLVPYHPAASAETRTYQEALVKQVGTECQRLDSPLLVEFTSYPIVFSTSFPQRRESDPQSGTHARPVEDDKVGRVCSLADERLTIVAQTAKNFDGDDFGITIHKLEFPGDIQKHAHQQLVESCQNVNQSITKPWVLLSAGVTFDIFQKEVAIATEHGASGFLAGRAIWQEAVGLYDEGDPHQGKMRGWLQDVGVGRLSQLRRIGQSAQSFASRISCNDKFQTSNVK